MPVLDLNLKPSLTYLCLLATVFFITAVIISSLAVSQGFKWMSLAVLGLYALYAVRKFAFLLDKEAIIKLRRFPEGRWCLQTNAGEFMAELLGETTVTQFATLLRFKEVDTARFRSSVIFPDALASGQYRKMLVTLKMRKS